MLGLLLTYKAIREPENKENNVEISMRKFGKRRLYSLLLLMMYPLLLEPLGFIIATLLLLFFLFKILEPRKWFIPILISFITVILSYFIFYVWLRINFPKGVFNLG